MVEGKSFLKTNFPRDMIKRGLSSVIIRINSFIKKETQTRNSFFQMLTRCLQKPLVSVIIPARNKEENIARWLRSIITQCYENYEVIVVYDESKDRTQRKIGEIQEGSERIN